MRTLIFVLFLAAAALAGKQKPANEHDCPSGKYVPVHAYDPKRDAAKDIEAAVTEARCTHKRVLVEVGGNWCSWCRLMDRFFEQQQDLLTLRERNFILLKIDYTDKEDKKNSVFATFPKIPGTPHLFVLDENGKLLHSQDTSELEQGQGYNLEKFTKFLKAWAPQGLGTARTTKP